MRGIVAILDILCTVLESFWGYAFINAIFERRYMKGLEQKHDKVIFGVCVFLSSAIVAGMNRIVLVSPYTSLVWMLSVVICTLIFWKGDILSAVAIVGIYVFMVFIYSNIIITTINLIGNEQLLFAITSMQGMERMLFLSIYHFFWGILNICIIKICKKSMGFQNDIRRYAYISLIGVAGGVFFCTQFLISASIQMNFMWYIFLLFVAALIYGSYYKVKKEAYEYETELLMKHTDLLEKNYEQLSNFYRENAKVYHDMNHHFHALYHLLEQGDQKQAKEYIENIATPTRSVKVPKRCGIDMIDVVLFEMEQKAQSSGTSIDMVVPTLSLDINIDKKDICLLLVNLLNNAIEAARNQVHVNIKQAHEMLIIEVVNDYKVRPIKEGNRFRSTKADKAKHGWGMQIIEQIMQKYSGSIEYKVDEAFVYANIILNEL